MAQVKLNFKAINLPLDQLLVKVLQVIMLNAGSQG